jgi:hypothetical protein
VASQSQGSTQISQVRQVLGDVAIPDPIPEHALDAKHPVARNGSRRVSKRKLKDGPDTTLPNPGLNPDFDFDQKLDTSTNMDASASQRGLRIKRSRAPLGLSGTTVDEGSMDGASLAEDGSGSGSGSRRRSARISRSGSHPGMSLFLPLN